MFLTITFGIYVLPLVILRKGIHAKWLRCKIAKGMFSDEYTIIVRTRSGENVAVFVPKYYA